MNDLYKIVNERGMCSLPWLHVEINFHNNTIQPCCKFKGNLGTIQTEFPVTWTGEQFNKLRKDMLNNVKVENCVECEVPEGVFSYKKWKNRDYRELMSVDTQQPVLPKVFHFALKNTCNLACRMCFPGSSSKLEQMVKKSDVLKKYFINNEQNNIIDVKKFKGSFYNAEYITFSGGEPLIDSDCLVLAKIIKEESKKLKKINFSTNMTKLNYELLEELSNIDAKIQFSVSIDGPPNINDYIRHKSNWNTIVENLKYIRSHYPKFLLAINTTVSILNVGYIIESLTVFHELEKQLNIKFNHIMISPVVGRPFLQPGLLPEEIKNLYLEKLKNHTSSFSIPESKNLISTAIKLINDDPQSSLEEFYEYISEFDKLAGTDYKIVYPEFGALAKN